MIFEPGIYFGLPESDYHAAEALSNSGIKNLLISPLDYWARTPWLNPAYQPEESRFMTNGSAYHKRILEGREAFQASYAPALDREAHPEALVTMDDMKAWLRARELPVSGKKADLVTRILEDSPNVEIWDQLLSDYGKANEGKTFLAQGTINEIEIAAAMIERHPQLSKAFSGGYPEVSIFWEADGVPMKARLDYLKPQAVVDLKTFSNPLGKPIDRAITQAMASGRYHVQAYVYMEAIAAAHRYLTDPERVFGWTADTHPAGFLGEEQTFLFVFQQTGVAPVARGKVFPKGLVYDCGGAAVHDARKTWKEYTKLFGSDPWVDQAEIATFDDTDFPAWIAEL